MNQQEFDAKITVVVKEAMAAKIPAIEIMTILEAAKISLMFVTLKAAEKAKVV